MEALSNQFKSSVKRFLNGVQVIEIKYVMNIIQIIIEEKWYCDNILVYHLVLQTGTFEFWWIFSSDIVFIVF